MRRSTPDIINQVLEEAGKFASDVVFPLNHSGDREGCHLDPQTHTVKTPKGFEEAYKTVRRCRMGVVILRYGIRRPGLPIVMKQFIVEMMNSANQAWTMYPGLSHGAYEMPARARHARAEGDVFAQAGFRRMDRHHVSDRGTLRH